MNFPHYETFHEFTLDVNLNLEMAIAQESKAINEHFLGGKAKSKLKDNKDIRKNHSQNDFLIFRPQNKSSHSIKRSNVMQH